MKRPFARGVRRVILILALTRLAPDGRAAEWEPIPPEELQATASTIDPQAGAEILFKDVRVMSDVGAIITRSHVRLKVYTTKGVAELAKIDLWLARNEVVDRLDGRLVKPDGTIVRLDPKSIFTRDAVRQGSYRRKVKSFSFPGLEPGVIIEYRWHTRRQGAMLRYAKFNFQSEWPARRVRYHVRLSSWVTAEVGVTTFNCRPQASKQDSQGFLNFEELNVPAEQIEPFAPPDDVTESWVLVHLLPVGWPGERFWEMLARSVHEESMPDTRPSEDIRRLAEHLVSGVTDDTEKLRRLYEHASTRITNTALDADPDLRAVDFRNPGAVLSAGRGDPEEVNVLFAALARAAKFDARIALVADRSQRFFRREFQSLIALPDPIIAVRRGGRWEFFDPGAGYVPFGALQWKNENVSVLVAALKDGTLLTTPETPADQTAERHTADLQLDTEGNLAGTITVEHTGHFAVAQKLALHGKSSAEVRDVFRGELARRLGSVEVSDFVVENLDGIALPLRMSATVKVSGYAERAGRRLFVQPAFFQKGVRPVFEADTRRFDIYFPFPFRQEDDVQMTVPEGFTLEQGTAPKPLRGGQAFTYDVKLAWTPTKRTLHYERGFTSVGVLFRADRYAALKQLHDDIRVQDAHTVALAETELAKGAP